jgi:hypothetical protein
MPLPRDQFRFEFDLAGVRANPGLLEDLVEIYQTALAELRRWDDRRHAALIAQLEELHTLAQRELRYRRSREDAAAELAAGSHRWRRWLRARRPA